MIIAQPVVDITRLEKEIQKAVNEIGRNLLRDALEKYDHELMINRDTEIYRHRGKKQTVLRTVMGEVTYSRVSYEYTDEQGGNARFFA